MWFFSPVQCCPFISLSRDTARWWGMLLRATGKSAWRFCSPVGGSTQDQSPKIFNVGGMGLITQHEHLEEGRYNILLSGRHRYRIVEFVRKTPYRVARVELLQEVMPSSQEMNEISTQLVLGFRELNEANTQPGLEADVIEKLDFPTLVNSVCSSLNFSVFDQQQLLEMNSVKARATSILDILERQIARERVLSKFRHIQPEDPNVN